MYGRNFPKLSRITNKEGFEPFYRTDTELWSYPRLLFGAIFLFPFRLICMIIVVSSYLFWVSVLTLGHDMEQPLTNFRRKGFVIVNKIFPRIALMIAGYIRIKTNKLQDYDYSKWLGKDYKAPEFYASSISNHSAWTDMFVMLIRTGGVSFVAKESIRNVFLFGKVGIALNTIFVSRISSTEDRENAVKMIQDRQTHIMEGKGKNVNLHIFPEGATTNNNYLIPFKRGVFTSLSPVLPIFVKYSSSYFNPAHDVIPMHYHFFVLLCQISNNLEVTELPIFEPNDFLFTNHGTKGQEKWKVYADAVRDVMSEVSGLPTHEASLKQKNECKKMLYGSGFKED